MDSWSALPTFPTGTFNITTNLGDKCGFLYTYQGQDEKSAYSEWFVASHEGVTHFVCVDGQNHDDGSWSAKLKVNSDNPYKGYYLDSKDGWLCAKSSTTERWRFIVKGGADYELWQVSTNRPVELTHERKGNSRYLRCIASPKATPELLSVTRW